MIIPTETYALLNTSHLAFETMQILDPDQPDTAGWRDHVLVTMHGRYGLAIYLPEPSEYRGEDGDIPDDLVACFEAVRHAGHQRVMFDADVDVVDGLPTYDW